MDVQPMRNAYSALSEQYIDLFDDTWQGHQDERALIRGHLADLPGRVFDPGYSTRLPNARTAMTPP